MKRALWKPIVAGMVFGASVGFLFGLRRIDTLADQELYWLWLVFWVIPGAAFGAISGLAYELLRRG
jgi:hypothetical protein